MNKSLLTFILCISCISIINGQALILNGDDLTAVRWLAQQFYIDWSLLNTDCVSIQQSSLALLTCVNDTSNNQYVTEIFSSSIPSNYVKTDQLAPSNTTPLKMSKLKTFVIAFPRGIQIPSANLLALLDNDQNTNLWMIKINTIDIGIPLNFPVYIDYGIISGSTSANLLAKPMKNIRLVSKTPPVIVQLPLTQNYSTLSSINIDFVNYDSYNFSQSDFPSLTEINFGYIKKDMNLYVQSKSIKTLLITDTVPANITITGSTNITNLEFKNQTIYPTDLTSYSIRTFKSLNNQQDFKLSGISTLSRYNYNGPFPSESTFSTTTSIFLDFQGGNIAGSLPSYTNNVLISYLKINDYPSISGAVPDNYCRIYSITLTNTNITSVPDCFKCYWSKVKSGMPETITAPPVDFQCNISLDSKIYKYQGNSAITIRGKNLGFAPPLSDQFKILIPNEVILFVPPKPGAHNLTFLPDQGAQNITIIVDSGNTVNGLRYLQIPNAMKIILDGVFNVSSILNATLDGFKNDDVVVTANIVNFTFNQVFDIDKTCTFVFIPPTGPETMQFGYRKNYPFIGAASNLTTNGGAVTLYGRFGSQPLPYILINNVVCAPTSKTDRLLICIVGRVPVGVAPLYIKSDGYTFSTQMMVDPAQIIIDCGNTKPLCNGNGDCLAAGYCQCYSGFNGYYCENKIFDGGVIGENTTKPSPTFIVNGEEFSFNMISIEELDSSRNVIKSIPTNNWNFNTTKNSTKTVTRYQLNHTSSEFIEATIQYSSEPMNVEFAGLSYVLPPNSIKLSISIDGWTYESLLNTLRVVFSTQFDEQNDCSFEKNSIGNNQIDNSINYLKIVKNGISFYGKFYDVSLSDGQPTYSFVEVVNNTNPNDISIGINLSQCQRCFIDPDFSLLVAVKDKCEEKSKTWIIITVVCVVGSVLLGLIVIGAFYLKKNKSKIKLQLEVVMEKFEKK
ncbi:EGF-like domain-containing protein [Heterostelium album PN500]|uniref:EGF-like domain-containing protein n=1 Tax=Heterostelium pallidum (strain ATCC 26659 / Pp 5 / PN500) TaxID=670386 RepID=D3B984_HETP5|nr:EGF-like domain-containing protein [Heterostelium album PN500]EFA82123.1 EGF-like domain-containing protein [Heterostelium album PN500]|eukprot:XP_020434240.1 EGF-like domain-containing protein [Heterostelium album PN500]